MTDQCSGDSRIAITRLSRISNNRLTAWTGETSDRRQVHVSYQLGWLSIDVRERVGSKPSGSTWRKVVRIETAILEAEAAGMSERSRGKPRSTIAAAYRRRLMEERAMQEFEMRRSMNRDRKARGPLVTFAQLQKWLELVVAGGHAPVELLAWFETEDRTERVSTPAEAAQMQETATKPDSVADLSVSQIRLCSPAAEPMRLCLATPLLVEIPAVISSESERPNTESAPAESEALPEESQAQECSSRTIVALISHYHAKPCNQTRNALFSGLKQRLETVTGRTACNYGIGRSDTDDVVQEALRKFAQQERRRTGIFDPSGAAELSAEKVSRDIKGSVHQRLATWYRAEKRWRKIICCSVDDVQDEVGTGATVELLEYPSARERTFETELRRDVAEVISHFVAKGSDSFTTDAIDDAMTHGRFNTAELSRRHQTSQPTAWRQVQETKRQLRSVFVKCGYGRNPWEAELIMA